MRNRLHAAHAINQPALNVPHPTITEMTRSLHASASGRLITAAAGQVVGVRRTVSSIQCSWRAGRCGGWTQR